DLGREPARPGERGLVGEVAAGLAGIALVALLLAEVLEPALLPVGDRGRPGLDLLQLAQELLVVALGARPRELPHALDELARAGAATDHLVGGDVVGPVAEPEQRRLLGAQLQDLLQHALVVPVAAAAERDVELAA